MLKENYWDKALIKTGISIKSKSLFPLNTLDITTNIYDGDDFVIRELDISKFKKDKVIGPKINPFKPWEKNLDIDSVGKNHHLILNKYPVQLGHLLLITNTWKSQSGWLERSDWEAIKAVNNDTTGLWFFNSGPLAGASQPHRHFQLLRRDINEINCPREKWFLNFSKSNNLDKRFLNNIFLKKFKSTLSNENIYETYLELSERSGIGSPKKDMTPKHPYNFLLTNKWIALIRRKTDNLYGISINALGYAGYLLITNRSKISYLRKYGPEDLLIKFL